eukprot:scaffold111577_cov63-Phaeocystis_antarctica.AAC.1
MPHGPAWPFCPRGLRAMLCRALPLGAHWFEWSGRKALRILRASLPCLGVPSLYFRCSEHACKPVLILRGFHYERHRGRQRAHTVNRCWKVSLAGRFQSVEGWVNERVWKACADISGAALDSQPPPDTSFFDMGLDSLGLAELVIQIEEVYGEGVITIDDILSAPTLCEVASLLPGGLEAAAAPAKAAPTPKVVVSNKPAVVNKSTP